MCNDSVSLGVQIHGGMGFIEETGAAQHLRDARIQTIYEGTTGIQANDLLIRKLLRDSGASMDELIALMHGDLARLNEAEPRLVGPVATRLEKCIAQLEKANRLLSCGAAADLDAALMVATPFLMLAGTVCGAWQWGKAAAVSATRLSEGATREAFYGERIMLARFYMTHVATAATALLETIDDGLKAFDATQ